jgi:hypothetical protein
MIVPVLAGPSAGGFDVLCFRLDCWEHGEYGTAPSPFVDDADERTAALLAARRHRQEIANQGDALCQKCQSPNVNLIADRFEQEAFAWTASGNHEGAQVWNEAAAALRKAMAGEPE